MSSEFLEKWSDLEKDFLYIFTGRKKHVYISRR